MLSFIKNTLKTIYSTITSQLGALFGASHVDNATLDQLERILLEADTGVVTTRSLIAHLKQRMAQGTLKTGEDLKKALHQQLLALIQQKTYTPDASVYLFVGINGSGKTTSAAKLANLLKQQGHKVLLVAADTFRAAAVQQLQTWAERLEIDLVVGNENADPASVIYTACQKFSTEGYDKLIIDTAGRLQTKTNLMKELEKIGAIIQKKLPDKRVSTLLTIDAMLGQNSFDQARLFHESTKLDGIVLTKMDGTAKGGIVFAIMKELNVPVAYITFGEQVEQIRSFDAQQFVDELVNS